MLIDCKYFFQNWRNTSSNRRDFARSVSLNTTRWFVTSFTTLKASTKFQMKFSLRKFTYKLLTCQSFWINSKNKTLLIYTKNIIMILWRQRNLFSNRIFVVRYNRITRFDPIMGYNLNVSEFLSRVRFIWGAPSELRNYSKRINK